MKKIVLITLATLFMSGCSANTEDVKKEVVNKTEPVKTEVVTNIVPETKIEEKISNDLKDVPIGYPLCTSAYKKENFTKEILIDTYFPFMPTSAYENSLNRSISDLFDVDEFVDLVNKSELFTFCFYDDDIILFSFYDGDRTNVAGIYSTRSNDSIQKTYVTDTRPFRPQGDLYGCKISGLIDGTMYYTCGSGDGCGGTEQIYSLNLNGEKKTLKDCDYGCAIEGWAPGESSTADSEDDVYLAPNEGSDEFLKCKVNELDSL